MNPSTRGVAYERTRLSLVANGKSFKSERMESTRLAFQGIDKIILNTQEIRSEEI